MSRDKCWVTGKELADGLYSIPVVVRDGSRIKQVGRIDPEAIGIKFDEKVVLEAFGGTETPADPKAAELASLKKRLAELEGKVDGKPKK